ncbi:hypothetical protein [Leptospira sp. GIMC2001]|uniref:hypothetical protein n=1 Tax=Leptospira sp. GIMC2001 TaxID=1513297 RepID=UPI00234AAE58|nr:hypothetical protein [Leptospira sp. GIMC2001]WCL51526.1 hypothetical protein O4O04_20125 [Leptospira sp. GIMC2001]
MDQSGATDIYREYNDKDYTGFKYFLSANELAIDAWEEILDTLVTPLIPASTTKNAALLAFRGAALGMNLDASFLVAALNAFKNALGSGMAGYTHVKSDFILTDIGDPSLAIPSISGEVAANVVIGKIFYRMTQQKAVLISPPNTEVSWS